MRIVIASDLYLPVYNGVAQFSENLAVALAKRGHDVLVVAASATGKKYQEKINGYTIAWVTSLPFPFFPGGHRISVNPVLEVKKIMNDFMPDVVHLQTPLAIGLAVRTAANKMGIPVVTTNHAMPENVVENLKLLTPVASQAAYLVKEYGSWFYSKKINYITMPTQAAINMFKDRKLGAPVQAVSCGIDLGRFKPGPVDPALLKKFGVPKGKQIVLYAGRLDGEKHLSVLIEAAHAVHKKKDIHVVISGSGNDEENLKALVGELGMQDYVSFLGRVSGEDLPKVYRLGTVFAMPSPAELQSIVTMEAMATGLPIVAVDAGALYELCQDGRNGYICKTDNSADMANKLLKILDDKQLAATMGKESVAIAKLHDIGHTAGEFEEIYARVIKTAKPVARAKTLV